MLYQQLELLSEQLRVADIKLSDGLIITLRMLRDQMPAEELLWLNRELLGYRQDDLDALNEPAQSPLVVLVKPPGKKQTLAFPSYRFLTGSWGKMDRAGRFVCVDEKRLAGRSIFCNIGIQQIETQIDELDGEGLFSMSYDASTGAEFYIRSKELNRVYESVREKLCNFVDAVIEELKLSANEA